MKTRFFRQCSLGLTLAVFPLAGGCTQPTNESVPSLAALALAEPAVQTVASTNAAPAATVPEPEPAREPAERPEPAPSSLAVKPLPPSIQPSSPVAEVIKLTQGGVDDGVVLTYITNSTSTFSLGSDEIIYLKDIGVPDDLIRTMIEHDQVAKQFWADAAAAQAAASSPAPVAPATQPEEAAAPSYVNPPQPVPAEPQPTVVNNNYFYDTLSPYGSWVNVDGYGMCWQPTVVVVNRNWRPYCDGGRWLYTDSGWYWYSDYTWGWAPFHYGRWFSHPRWGWCWNPGYTWGPAWVSWRYTDGYCGWAPLPPAAYYSAGVGFSYYGSSVGFSFGFGLGYSSYTFVPWNRFCDYRPYKYCAPPHHARDIYHNSTVANNYHSGKNNTVVNGGIPPERVSSFTRQEVRKVAVRDASLAGKSSRGERLDAERGTVAVHRPRLPQETPLTATPARNESGRSESRVSRSPGTTGITKSLATEPTAGVPERTPAVMSPANSGTKRDEQRSFQARTVSQPTKAASPEKALTASSAEVRPGDIATAAPVKVESPARAEKLAPQRNLSTPAERTDSKVRGQANANTTQPVARPAPASEATTSPAPAAPLQAAPAASPPVSPRTTKNSVVVIGNKNASQPRGQSYSVWGTSPNTPTQPKPAESPRQAAPTPASPQPAPAVSQNVTTPSTPSRQRQETIRSTPNPVSRSGGKSSYSTYSTPSSPTVASTPAYSPPVSAPRPSPNYNSAPAYTPRPAPAAPRPSYSPPVSSPMPASKPSYSPPVSSPMPAPRPSYSAPSSSPTPVPASPSRSESGQRGRR